MNLVQLYIEKNHQIINITYWGECKGNVSSCSGYCTGSECEGSSHTGYYEVTSDVPPYKIPETPLGSITYDPINGRLMMYNGDSWIHIQSRDGDR